MIRLVLVIIAVIGLGWGLLTILGAPKLEGGMIAALLLGGTPFLIGTVALGAAAIMERVDVARDTIVTAIREANAANTKAMIDAKRSAVVAADASKICVRCGRVRPVNEFVESAKGPICTEGCERAS